MNETEREALRREIVHVSSCKAARGYADRCYCLDAIADTVDRIADARVKAALEAVTALADEWEADHGILSPDSRYTRDVLLRELRAAIPQVSRRPADHTPPK